MTLDETTNIMMVGVIVGSLIISAVIASMLLPVTTEVVSKSTEYGSKLVKKFYKWVNE